MKIDCPNPECGEKIINKFAQVRKVSYICKTKEKEWVRKLNL